MMDIVEQTQHFICCHTVEGTGIFLPLSISRGYYVEYIAHGYNRVKYEKYSQNTTSSM